MILKGELGYISNNLNYVQRKHYDRYMNLDKYRLDNSNITETYISLGDLIDDDDDDDDDVIDDYDDVIDDVMNSIEKSVDICCPLCGNINSIYISDLWEKEIKCSLCKGFFGLKVFNNNMVPITIDLKDIYNRRSIYIRCIPRDPLII
jgi:hypothetical protein